MNREKVACESCGKKVDPRGMRGHLLTHEPRKQPLPTMKKNGATVGEISEAFQLGYYMGLKRAA